MQIEILQVDFSTTDIYDEIRAKLQSLDGPIHVLVNNVGCVHHCPEYFASHPDGYHLKLINVNIVSMTLMSEIVLRIMTKTKQTPSDPILSSRPRGVIINISSLAGVINFPLSSTYCSCKFVCAPKYGKFAPSPQMY